MNAGEQLTQAIAVATVFVVVSPLFQCTRALLHAPRDRDHLDRRIVISRIGAS